MKGKRSNKQWMTIKIDLEKAYNRVQWEFINASTQAVGIPNYIRNVIMSAISNSIVQVFWNGVPTQKFRLARGIRQGTWCPIWLSCSRPALSHIFFADDLVIFRKADVHHSRLLKDILETFCAFSGHIINAKEMNIFFSSAVREDLERVISDTLGFQKVEDMRYYLGVPLFHERVTNSTLRFVVEKVRDRLQSWEVREISLAGRVTLAQVDLLSIPAYFIPSMMIPKGIYEEIECMVRYFTWGSSNGWKKMSLVSRDLVCQPRYCGGLELRQLRD
ncbi:hypothetical protein PVK06_039618 [Gossypium arboreum]|uniref:Reverse transcriptase domain-containing protein n=1 Tax=Gossypium arboreum TaxID=29729 RepID=A0ABR0N3C5_GOSAR|nr:hypothetical protein PVK06_039618 [Gossypium arboreum]